MSNTDGYRIVTQREHVTAEILDAVRSICDGWYADDPIDWEDVWDRLENSPLADETKPDLGGDLNSPAMRYIQRTIRAERKAGS